MIYKYLAINKNTGLKEDGTIELGIYENPQQFLDKHLILLNIRPDVIGFVNTLFKKKMSLLDLSRFFGYLAEFQSMGTDIVRTIGILKKTLSRRYTPFLEQLIDEITKGRKLSEAMSSSDMVPSLAVTLVRAGEETGSTKVVYERLKDFYDKFAEARSKSIKSLVYPVVVFILVIIVVAVFSFILMPKLALVTETLSKGNLPFSTKLIFFIATIFRRFWWSIPIIIFAGFVFLVLFRSYRPIEFYRIVSNIPIAGNIFRHVYISQLFVYLEIFQKNGVSLLDALDHIYSSVKNPYIGLQIKNSADMVRVGETYSKTLGDFFPPFVIESVSIGEEQGSLEKSFRDISEYYNRRLDEELSSVSQYLEIGLILIVGLLIAAIGIGLFIPIYKGLTSIKI